MTPLKLGGGAHGLYSFLKGSFLKCLLYVNHHKRNSDFNCLLYVTQHKKILIQGKRDFLFPYLTSCNISIFLSSDDMDQPLKKTMHNASNAESTFTCTPNRELVVAASSPNLVKVSAHEISIHKEHVLQNNLDKTYEKFMEIPDFVSIFLFDTLFSLSFRPPPNGEHCITNI